MAREKFTYEEVPETLPSFPCRPKITDQGGRLTLQLEWLEEQNSTETLPLPRCVDSVDCLKIRKLQVSWADGASASETFSSLLEGLSTYISMKYPGWWLVTPVKIYEQLPHGVISPAQWSYIPVIGKQFEIKEDAEAEMKRSLGFWTGGYSDVVFVSPEAGYRFADNINPRFPFEIPRAMFILMFDFDIYKTSGDLSRDIREAAETL